MKLKKIFLSLMLVFCAITSYAQYDINHFFSRGRQLLIDGKYSAAIDNFNILTIIDTTLYDAYFFRGIAKYNLGDFIGAEKDFDHSLRLNPIYTPAYHYRAITLSRTGKYDEALKDLAEAVDLRPSYTGLYFSRGVTYFLSQQFSKAISDFNRFIKSEPKVADAYLNRGACYLFVGDTTKALADYNRAINLNMFDPEGYIRRSRVYAMQKKDDKAIEDLDNAIRLDSTNAFAYFNRALIKYEQANINGCLSDLNKVLDEDPGNALTLYNRALIRSQIGDYNNALDDYDRVLAVNPNNVLAYFNRAGVFMQLGQFRSAMDDYSKAINLYPDFAKAYLNRSYAKNQMGQFTSAKQDYEIAQKKIKEYQYKTKDSTSASIFADTTKKYDKLLALDADFAKKDFNDELLQHRDVDIRLKPLYKFILTNDDKALMAFEREYENDKVDKFISEVPITIKIDNKKEEYENSTAPLEKLLNDIKEESANNDFAKGIIEGYNNRFNSSLAYYNKAIEKNPKEIFYYINRGALQSEMIDFISSIESNVQVLTLDNSGAARARVQDQSHRNYDYTSAIHDMTKAVNLMPDFPYSYYNLGNLYCLSGDLPEAIRQYSKAISLYSYFGEAYYNRGLVLIYLKDNEKGCIDMSKAGELGINDAYSVIKKYCTKN